MLEGSMHIQSTPKVEAIVDKVMAIFNQEQPNPIEGLQIALSVLLSVAGSMHESRKVLDTAIESIKMMQSGFPSNDERVQ